MARLSRMLPIALLGCALLAAPAAATHVSCGDTITQDTTLDSDLVDCPGDGLVIGADGVTVDLAGHRIDGAGSGAGIRSENFGALEVRGGAISGFGKGVDTEDVHSIATSTSASRRPRGSSTAAATAPGTTETRASA